MVDLKLEECERDNNINDDNNAKMEFSANPGTFISTNREKEYSLKIKTTAAETKFGASTQKSSVKKWQWKLQCKQFLNEGTPI